MLVEGQHWLDECWDVELQCPSLARRRVVARYSTLYVYKLGAFRFEPQALGLLGPILESTKTEPRGAPKETRRKTLFVPTFPLSATHKHAS